MGYIEDSLKDMYELGVKHGYALAEKDAEIEKLENEVEKLEDATK